MHFITFIAQCFALDVAAVSAEPRATLLNKICKILQFLCRFVNSEYDGTSLHMLANSAQSATRIDCRILISLVMQCPAFGCVSVRLSVSSFV